MKVQGRPGPFAGDVSQPVSRSLTPKAGLLGVVRSDGRAEFRAIYDAWFDDVSRWIRATADGFAYSGVILTGPGDAPFQSPIRQGGSSEAWMILLPAEKLEGVVFDEEGAPIVTLSLGEERVFRLRPWKGKGFRDFPTTNRTALVLPYATNRAWTHEVPHAARFTGRRISVTFRAFEQAAVNPARLTC